MNKYIHTRAHTIRECPTAVFILTHFVCRFVFAFPIVDLLASVLRSSAFTYEIALSHQIAGASDIHFHTGLVRFTFQLRICLPL